VVEKESPLNISFTFERTIDRKNILTDILSRELSAFSVSMVGSIRLLV